MKRRDFLKVSAATAAVATVTGCSSDSADEAKPIEPPLTDPTTGESFAWASCQSNCWAWCPLKVVTKDNQIIRVDGDNEVADDFGSGMIQNRACAKGRMLKELVYSPERLKTPMKRVGPRGSGEFVPISWDEAFSLVAQGINTAIEQHGNQSIVLGSGSGCHGSYPIMGPMYRLMKMKGGFLKSFGYYSASQKEAAIPYFYGDKTANLQYGQGTGSSSVTEMLKSDLILSFGYNPLEMFMTGGGEGYHFNEVLQQKQVRFIYVDPRYTDSCCGREEDWFAIRPGTDTALIEALAHEIFLAGGEDIDFLDQHCIGHNRASLQAILDNPELFPEVDPATVDPAENYRDYILGQGRFDQARTPEWAAPITGIAAHRIRELAQALMAANAPFICSGQGIQRSACGEQAQRAIMTLPNLLGAVGRAGTNNGDLPMTASAGLPAAMMPMDFWSKEYEDRDTVIHQVSTFKVFEAIERGREMTGPEDGLKIKRDSGKFEYATAADPGLGSNVHMLITTAGNTVNQHGDFNEVDRILRSAPDLLQDAHNGFMFVVIDTQMTPTARYADILLPDTTWTERHELLMSDNVTQYCVPSVKPMFESRTSYEICCGIADKLGIGAEYARYGANHQELTHYFLEVARFFNPDLPDKEGFESSGYIYHHRFENAAVGMQKEYQKSEFSTRSGKVEIYSPGLQALADSWSLGQFDGDQITALPKYLPTWEGFEESDPQIRESYPLQLIGYHTKGRAHSTFHNCPTLRKVYEDALWINPIDAQLRNISSGDQVQVSTPRGTIEVAAKVTPRITVGVIALGQGAWQKGTPGQETDRGGCINTLTRQRPSPLAKGNPVNTNRAQVRLI